MEEGLAGILWVPESLERESWDGQCWAAGPSGGNVSEVEERFYKMMPSSWEIK